MWPEERRRDAAEISIIAAIFHDTLATFDIDVSFLHGNLISMKNIKLQCFGILFFFFLKNDYIHLPNVGLRRICEEKQKESCFNIWYKGNQAFCPKIILLIFRPGCKADI